MNRKIILIIFLFFLSGLIIFSFFKKTEKETRICFEDRCFSVELALTPEERKTGLMFRQKLDRNKGMLFVFENEGEYSFWMSNVLFPLDIIWINKDKKIVFIAENCQPCLDSFCPNIKPEEKAKYVLEINGGLVSEIGLSLGDKLEFDLNLNNFREKSGN